MRSTQARKLVLAASAAAALSLAAGPAFAGVTGTYKRPNGTHAKVWSCGGKLCAKVKETGFNMFLGGLRKSGKGWKGNMKHPKMGTWMTFNGSAVPLGGGKLRVKGCAMGQSMCDAETWRK